MKKNLETKFCYFRVTDIPGTWLMMAMVNIA